MPVSLSRRRLHCLALGSLAVTPLRAHAQTAAALEIGVLPNISARVLLAQYQPMREFLARETRRAVHVSTAPSWAAFHQRTLAADYDLIVTAAHLGRLAQIERGYQPLLVYAPSIKGLLVCAKSRPIRQPGELAGQTLVLSNPQSLVTMRGLQWLGEQGLQRQRDFKTMATPTDDSVGAVVVRSDAIAALCSGGEFRAIPEAIRHQLQIVSTFAEVPGFVVMANPALGAAAARALKEQLMQFASASDEGRSFLEATGFSGMRELPVGMMEAMDSYVEPTRRALTSAA